MTTNNPTSSELRGLISHGPMGTFQLVAIAVCVGLNMLDGFDVLVMSFTASGVSVEWKLSGGQLGLLISAGLVGMAAGSILLAPRADRFGRRSIILASVAIVSIGMLLSGFSRSFPMLGVLRVITGIGIGGILASATVLVAEYSSERWRSTASCVYTAGYSLGATIGGAIAALLIARYGWRSAFLFGALSSVAMLPLVYWGLPESLEFLITSRPPDALPRLNRLLTRMQRSPVVQLPPGDFPGTVPTPRSMRRLFVGPLKRSTVLIWISFFFVMGGYYFVFGWTPRLLTASGLSAQQGITSGVLLSLGGIVGTLTFAFVAGALEIRRLTCACLLAACALMALFAISTTHLAFALITGALLGGLTTGAMAGFYALTPTLYPVDVRATGMGWAIGIGRFGAIVSPIATGLLVDRGWHPMQLYLVFTSSFLIAMLGLAGISTPGTRWVRSREATSALRHDPISVQETLSEPS
jgi:benzoate transport